MYVCVYTYITHTKYQRCIACVHVIAAGDHHAFVERAPDDDAETKNIYNFILFIVQSRRYLNIALYSCTGRDKTIIIVQWRYVCSFPKR